MTDKQMDMDFLAGLLPLYKGKKKEVRKMKKAITLQRLLDSYIDSYSFLSKKL